MMASHRVALLGVAVLLAASLTAVCLVASPPAMARAHPPGTLTVCPSGPPDCDYDSIQAAVDAAADGDVIKVAAGLYSGVRSVPAPTGYVYPPDDGTLDQVVYVSKTLTLRGGYLAPGFAEPPDAVAHPATVDAAESGRALVAWGPISVTVEGLRLTGGTADGQGGFSWDGFRMDVGGCLYSSGANIALLRSHVSDCVAVSGGGLYVGGAGPARLTDNTLTGNTGKYYGGGLGGGAFIYRSEAIVTGNEMTANDAGNGGGVYLREGRSFLQGNLIAGNRADYAAGGLGTHYGLVTLDHNTFLSNTVSVSGDGGAIRCYNTPLTLTHSTLVGNTAKSYGGALKMEGTSAVLDGNLFLGNVARSGGAAYLSSVNSTFSNNLIADNRVAEGGSGLVLDWGSATLRHVTIARNTGGDGAGVTLRALLFGSATLSMTNAIIAGQEIGILLDAGSVALEATLWGAGAWANGSDWAGTGTFVTGTVNLWADPAFVASAAGDYHLGPQSAAVDAGIDAGVADDMDGQTRPRGCRPDIGADEYPGLPPVDDLHLVSVLEGGHSITATLGWTPPPDAVTYTLRVSTEPVTDESCAAAAVLTDSLPGSTERYTATLPYDSDSERLYFALKWAGCDDISTVSNNASWPPWTAYLPFILRSSNGKR